MNLQNRNRLTDLEEELMVTAGGRNRECGINMYTLLYFKWLANRGLLYSTGNSARCYVAAWMQGSLGEKGCVPILSLCCAPEIITLLISSTPV